MNTIRQRRQQDPPALAERLLGILIRSPHQRDSILGDLHEEYVARTGASRGGAALWYWLQSTRIALRLLTTAALTRAFQSDPIEPPAASHGDSLMRTLSLEIRHAYRSIVKRPALSAVLVLTIAVGLGANAAIFALIDALVLRPFTMPDVDRIVMVVHTRSDDLFRQETVSPADFLDWKQQTDVFERLAAFEWWDANLVGRDEPERAQGFFVSADFFPALGVAPALGRNFLPAEEVQGQHRRVILSHGLWQRRFAGDPTIVGQPVQIDGLTYDVVGIAPENFDFPMGAQLWAPLSFDQKTAARRRNRYLSTIARLAPGRSLEDAKAQMSVIDERIEAKHPDTNKGFDIKVYTMAQGMLDVGLGPILSLWQASAVFVLLIACANVASLLLARGAERQREMAVRLAIGASRARIIRERLIESAILALVAVPAALAITWVSLELIRGAMPARIARFVAGWQGINVDARLFVFTAALSLGTALIFGLVPAIQATRGSLTESMKDGGRSLTAGGGRIRLRRGLVIAEIALALPLLVACGLSALSVHRFLNGPQGYNPDGLLTMQVVLADAPYPTAEARLRFGEQAVERLRAVPGVQIAAAVNRMPSTGGNAGRTIEIEGRPNPDPANPPDADYRTATPTIFDTLQIPILAGRAFTDADRAGTMLVAIVSQSFTRRYWPNEDPIGRRLRFGTGPWLTVVGVSGDVIQNWFMRRNYPTVYQPMAQAPPGLMFLLVRTAGDPAALAADARLAIRQIDAAQPVFDMMVMRDVLRERTLGLRFVAAIMTVFGALALLLAVLGVYGVMAYFVTQRTHEIGVRMALGATSRDVLRLAVGQTGRLTAIGVVLGVLLSVALGRFIEAGLLGVATSDIRVTGGFAAMLVMSALIAGYVPARRATTINPIVALRTE